MVCRIKNRHTFKSLPILNSAYFTECRFVIRHITQTDTETETEANFTHLSDNFHLVEGGGYSETVLQNRGYSGRIWTKISTTPADSCITDSLSHTTYVETNN